MRGHPNRSRVAARKVATAAEVASQHDYDYSGLLVAVRASFEAAIASGAKLFATDAADLNDLYLDSLPPAERQLHNCHACQDFLRRYGHLVAVSEDGTTVPVMWGEGPGIYTVPFAMLQAKVAQARITGPFLSSLKIWGTPLTGEWSHMAVAPPPTLVFRERVLTPSQAAAAVRENFRTVTAALAEFKPAMLDEALRVLEAGALSRSERFVAPVRWLRALHDRPRGRRGENSLWAAVVAAPEGFCHPKASVVGPLLDDIAAGLPFADIKARFDAKVDPRLYQRPQAAPTAGSIKAAEDLVARLGIAASLERRFARLDECATSWLPKRQEAPSQPASVFGHLTPKDAAAVPRVKLPAQTMTWAKFQTTVLPRADKLDLLVPAYGRFVAFTTAADASAPPILKWDRESARNPVAWYTYSQPTAASQWRLNAGTWAKVNAISPFPTAWDDCPTTYLMEAYLIVLDGAVDSAVIGNALFPEALREEMHGARAVIEAYSRSAKLGGRENASACGIGIARQAADCTIRASIGGGWETYRIDRWD